MKSKLNNPWVNSFKNKFVYCTSCHNVDEHNENCVWLYASQLEAEVKRLRNRIQFAIDILPNRETMAIMSLMAALDDEAIRKARGKS